MKEILTTNSAKILVGYSDFILKSTTINDSEMSIINKICTKIQYDCKNRIVTIYVIEVEGINFYNILNNLFADKDVRILIKNKKPIITNSQKYYESHYPHILFKNGQVTSHNIDQPVRTDEIFEHSIIFKFNKMEFINRELQTL